MDAPQFVQLSIRDNADGVEIAAIHLDFMGGSALSLMEFADRAHARLPVVAQFLSYATSQDLLYLLVMSCRINLSHVINYLRQ